MATYTDRVLDAKIGNANPQRAYEGGRISYTAETDSPSIDKRGYGLVGISFPAFTTATQATFQVSMDDITFRAHETAAVDVTAAGAVSKSDLAEWPYIKVILDAADTGNVDIVFS